MITWLIAASSAIITYLKANSICTGVIYDDSGIHALCSRDADKDGLCKMHRRIINQGHARKPTKDDY